MGILQLYDKFFEDVPPGSEPQPGHLYWVPRPETNEIPLILNVRRATPDEHLATAFDITQVNNDHFKERERLPIKKLNLSSTEELFDC
ncbi:MAG: hypothetical protein U5P41_05460 [Gammaproteobacteria bacterium]|nr:hypothetical protein [Gammaproteobacteria bacterium]